MFLGNLLAKDRVTITNENYDAGRLHFIISKNVVKTNTGIYHLIGPIIKGSPNNLYRACLETNGIPKTWRYLLTQFSSKPPPNNQSITGRINTNGDSLYDLVRNYHFIRQLLYIAYCRGKTLKKSFKPIDADQIPVYFLRYKFHQKLIRTIKGVTHKIFKVIIRLLLYGNILVIIRLRV